MRRFSMKSLVTIGWTSAPIASPSICTLIIDPRTKSYSGRLIQLKGNPGSGKRLKNYIRYKGNMFVVNNHRISDFKCYTMKVSRITNNQKKGTPCPRKK